jgi:hypothetical protein
VQELSVRRNVWLRRPERNASFGTTAAAAALFAGAMTVISVVVAVLDAQPMSLAFLPLYGPAAYALGRVALGCFRAGVLIEDDVVVVRNPWRERRFPVAEVARFVAGEQPSGYGNPTPGVVLVLRDGSHVSIWSLAAEGLAWNNDRNAARWRGVADGLTAAL